MAIRECLMYYFKGTSVESVIGETNVNLNVTQKDMRGRPNVERVDIRNKEETLLQIDTLPILRLTKVPDTVELHVSILKRSPELREIREQLEQFLATYLPGVNVVEKKGSVFYG